MSISEYLRGLRTKVGTELVVVPSVTGVIYDAQGRVLLVLHANGRVWAAPGGAVDPDERPANAVVRELWEETGLHVEPVALCGVFGGPEFRVLYENGDQVAYVMAIFECRLLGGQLRPDGVETLEARYFEVGDVPGLHLAPWARAVLPPILARRGRAYLQPVSWTPPSAPMRSG